MLDILFSIIYYCIERLYRQTAMHAYKDKICVHEYETNISFDNLIEMRKKKCTSLQVIDCLTLLTVIVSYLN